MIKYKCLKCGHAEHKRSEQEVTVCSRCNGASVDLFKMAKYLECNKPLLTIELQDETSVPKVIYKGEEIKYKRHVLFDFDWDTDAGIVGGLTYAIEHQVDDTTVNRIERRVKGHAMD